MTDAKDSEPLVKTFEPAPWRSHICSCCSAGFCNCLLAFMCFPCFNYKLISRASPFTLGATSCVITKDFALVYVVLFLLIGNGAVYSYMATNTYAYFAIDIVYPLFHIMLLLGIANKYNVTEARPLLALKVLCCYCCFSIQAYDTVDNLESGLAADKEKTYGSTTDPHAAPVQHVININLSPDESAEKV